MFMSKWFRVYGFAVIIGCTSALSKLIAFGLHDN